MHIDNTKRLQLDRDRRSARYYRNAVERHWDPFDVDLSGDREGLVGMDEEVFTRFKAAVAKFGAGEQAVTEDLTPLGIVLEEVEDQLFITTQLYEEAKHTDFFDRYWREVIHAAERERGDPLSSPTEDRWFNDDYVELFERNEKAMDRLLTEDTPETRAEAFCHYHLVIEGILAQTGYWGLQQAYGGDQYPELPTLSGLTTGLGKIREDEGRHVGFGMAQLKGLLEEGVDPQRLHETVAELLPLVNGITTDDLTVDDPESDVSPADYPGPDPEDLTAYATEKHTERMDQIVDAARDIPDVESLTRLESD